MSPRKHHVVEAAMRFIDAVLCGIHRVVEVRVILEGVWVDILLREPTADNECIL